jgi:exopolyphosphatase/guanosine-5'-triphosphate,3'-diphosphate pyrophosphatase
VRLAVIDAGTNTFHLLIVETTGQTFHELAREREFVKLGEAGVERISQAAFDRGVAALTKFSLIIHRHEVSEIVAVGTATLRHASNSKTFLEEIKRQTGISLRIINGKEEAKLIADGVSLLLPCSYRSVLVVDIGGGSIEFVSMSQGLMQFSASLPVGIAVLKNKFLFDDPLTDSQYMEARDFVDRQFAPVFDKLEDPEYHLVGASGSFETVAQMLLRRRDLKLLQAIRVNDVKTLLTGIIYSTTYARSDMEFLPTSRVELIVPACIVIESILDRSRRPILDISQYALKEGLIKKYLPK